MAEAKKVKVTLLKSPFGRVAAQRGCITGLGLRKIRDSVVVANTPENRGMIERISFMLKVEEA